jgi:hypothetical protein
LEFVINPKERKMPSLVNIYIWPLEDDPKKASKKGKNVS